MSTPQILSFSGVPVTVGFDPSGTNIIPLTVTSDANLRLTHAVSDPTVVTISGVPLTLPVFGDNYGGAILTSYSMSGYTISADSVRNNPSSTLWKAFDSYLEANIEPFQGITGQYNASGIYIGSASTTGRSGVTYPGSWVQVQLPTRASIGSVSLITATNTFRLREAVLLGSNNGSSWDTLGSFSYTLTETLPSQPMVISVSGGESMYTYNYVRVVFRRLSGGDSLYLSNFSLSGTTGFTGRLLKTGSFTLTASNAGDSTYASVSGSQVVTVKLAQTINFTLASSTIPYNPSGTVIELSGSASSSLPLTYTVTSGSTIASISGTTLHVTGVGLVTIQASQEGNTNYSSATPVSQTLTVNQASQTIAFTLSPSTITFNPSGTVVNLSGSATSALPLTFSVSGSTIATLSGSNLIITQPGTISITATQEGDTTYAPATPVTQTLTVNKTPQSLSMQLDTPYVSPQGTFFSVDTSGNSGLTPTFTTSGTAVLRSAGFPNTALGNGFLNFTVSGYAYRGSSQNRFEQFWFRNAFDAASAQWIISNMYNTSGFYIGTKSTTSTSGIQYPGEWADFEPPAPLRISSIALSSIASGTMPRICHVLGTTSSGIYTHIETFTFENTASGTMAFSTPPRFKGYRIVFERNAANNFAEMYIDELVFRLTPNQAIYQIVQSGTVTIQATQAGNTAYNQATPVSQTFTFTKASQTLALTTFTSTNTFNPSGTFIAVDSLMNSALTPTFTTSGTAVLVPMALSLPSSTLSNTTSASASGFTYRTSSITSSVSGGNFGVSAAFDGSGSTYWASAAGVYNASNGSVWVSGGRTWTTENTTYTGEWMEVELPVPLELSAINLLGTNANAFPRVGHIFGSATGASGTYVLIRSFTFSSSTTSSGTISMANTSPYKIFRMVVQEIGSGSAGVNATQELNISSLGFTFSPQQALYQVNQAGSVVITATQAGDSFYDPVTTTSSILTINKANQTISFPLSSSDILYSPSGTIVALSASATSGLQVSFTTSGSSIASVSGSNLIIHQPGVVIITATQAGNETFGAATPVSQTVTIGKASQTIVFTGQTYNYSQYGSALPLNSTASSNLPVTYVSSDTSIATISGSSLFFWKAGSVSITAQQDGDSYYLNASPVTVTYMTNLLVRPSSEQAGYPALNVTDNNNSTFWRTSENTYDSTSGVYIGSDITATSSGAIYAGEYMELNSTNPVYITFANLYPENISGGRIRRSHLLGSSTGASGSWTHIAAHDFSITTSINISNIIGQKFLFHRFLIETIVTGTTYAQYTNLQLSIVTPSTQSISFSLSPLTYYVTDGSIQLDGTASSNLPVQYSSSDPSVISMSGTSAVFVGVGTATITAEQSGSVNFDPAPSVSQTLTITKAPQTITFLLASGSIPYSLNDTIVTLSGFASSSLPLTYTVTSGSSIASISGSNLVVTGAGLITIEASQAGDTNYQSAAPVSQTLTITQATQTISFTLDSATTTYNPSGTIITLSGSSTSSLPLTYTVTSGSSIASISGSTLYVTGAGTVTIQASQAGDKNYLSATSVSQTLTVNKAPQTLSMALSQTSPLVFNPSGTYVSLDISGNSGLPPTFSTSGAVVSMALALPVPTSGDVLATASGFTYRASSFHGTWPVFRAFDTDNSNMSRWASAVYVYDTSSGGYTGSVRTTTTSGVQYAGEWIEVEFPAPLKPSSVSFVAPTNNGLPEGYVLGSPTGASGSFTLLQSFSMPTTLSGTVILPSSVTPIKVLRVVAGRIWLNNGFGCTTINTLSLGFSSQQALYQITQPGNVVFTASQSGDANYNAATPVSETLSVTQAPQTISFSLNPSTITYSPSGTVVNLSGSSTSSLPLTYTVTSGSSIASISGTTLYITGAGSVTIEATQEGDSNYDPATPVTQTLTVNKASQTLAFTLSPSTITYNPSGTVIALSASGTSNLPVTFSVSSGSSIATISGSNLYVTGAGSITITATQDGDSNYEAATPATQTLIVEKASQTLSLALDSSTVTYNQNGTYVSVDSSGNSGLTPTFTTSGTAVSVRMSTTLPYATTGTLSTSVSGFTYRASTYADFNDVSRAFDMDNGTYWASATGMYNNTTGIPTSSGSITTTISGTQYQGEWLEIECPAPLKATTFSFISVNTNGVPRTFHVLGSATGAANSFTLIQTFYFDGSSVNASGNITIANRYKVFRMVATQRGPGTAGQLALAKLDLVFAAQQALYQITSPGSLTITATQDGDSNYEAANPVTQTITVNKASQTISFTLSPSTITYNPSGTVIALSASGTSNLPVTFTVSSGSSIASVSGSNLYVTGAGSVTITATQAGNSIYEAATPVTQTLTVNKASQSIAFTLSPSTITYNPSGTVITLSASGTSNLPVTFTISGSSIATVSGSNLYVTGAGTVMLTATQTGNSNYEAATPVTQTLTVNKASQTIAFTLSPSTITYDPSGSVIPLSASATSSLPVTFTVTSGSSIATISGSNLIVNGVGTVTVVASQGGNSNYLAASNISRIVTITKAVQTLTTSATNVPYSSSIQLSPTFTSGLAVTSFGLATEFPHVPMTANTTDMYTALASSNAGNAWFAFNNVSASNSPIWQSFFSAYTANGGEYAGSTTTTYNTTETYAGEW